MLCVEVVHIHAKIKGDRFHFSKAHVGLSYGLKHVKQVSDRQQGIRTDDSDDSVHWN